MYLPGTIMGYKLKYNPLLILIIVLLTISNNFPQEASREMLKKAEDFYKTAEFDNSIETLTKLSSDISLDENTKKEVLRLLGKAYTAKGLYDEAQNAILELLKLDPSVDFNPDNEPPVFMKIYYDSRKKMSGSYEVEKPDPGMKTMAIIDFKNRSIDKKAQYDPMEQGFADLLIHELNNSTGLKVIERERLQWILDEIKLQDEYSMEGAVRAGKQLGVQTVLLGSFIIVNDQLWLGGRLVKVESSEILLTDEIKGELDQFFDLIDKLAEKISEKIEVTIDKDPKADVKSDPSLEAVLAYSVGLNYLERQDYKNAYAKFQEALKYDPEYSNAKLKAESIAPYL